MTNGYNVAMPQDRKKLDPISIRLEADVKANLEALAVADERSLSAYINRVLRAHVELAGKRKK